MEDVLKYLDKLNIKYDIVHHPPATTTEEADEYVKGKEGVLSKTLFMAGRKDRNFYLFVMDEKKRLDLKKISELVDDRLHFGREEDLFKKMNLKPGTVSIFGLLNNKDHDIKIYIDKEVMEEKLITFHPNENTATVFISVNDMISYLDSLDNEYKIIEL